jgi:hypothetical protein
MTGVCTLKFILKRLVVVRNRLLLLDIDLCMRLGTRAAITRNSVLENERG